LLLGIVPNGVLLPMLAAILLISAVKIWRHEYKTASAKRIYDVRSGSQADITPS